MAAKFEPATANPRAELVKLERALRRIRARIAAREESSIIDWAQEQYRERRRRNAIFGNHRDLFGEPAWDILLDLLAAHFKRQSISISSACLAADVAPTTALRYINHLETRGLVYRVPDPEDRRRSHLRLTADGLQKMLQMQEPLSAAKSRPASDQ